jgi:hypothetical protein
METVFSSETFVSTVTTQKTNIDVKRPIDQRHAPPSPVNAAKAEVMVC